MPTIAAHNLAKDSNARARSLARLMASMAAVYAVNPQCREAAQQILKGVDSRDVSEVAKAIDAWLRRNVAYHDNPLTGQSQPSPAYVWEQRSAPCTGAAFTAAIALASGNKPRLVLWGGEGDHFYHVFTEIWDPKRKAWAIIDWVPRDGFDRRRLLRGLRQEFDVSVDKVQDPKRVFISCTPGERIPVVGAIGLAFDEFVEDAKKTVTESLNKLKAGAEGAATKAVESFKDSVKATVLDTSSAAIQQAESKVVPWIIAGFAALTLLAIAFRKR